MPIHKIHLPHSPILNDNNVNNNSPTSPTTNTSISTNNSFHNIFSLNMKNSNTNSNSNSNSFNDSFNSLNSTLNTSIHNKIDNINNNYNNYYNNNKSPKTYTRSISNTSLSHSPILLSHNSSSSIINNNYNNNNNNNLLKKSYSNLNNLNSNTFSSTSLHSMLSNQSATTEYSPNLIENECGDLLKIVELDLSNENENNDDNDTNDNNTTQSNIDENISNKSKFNTVDSFLTKHHHNNKNKPKFNINNDLSTDSEDSETDIDYDDLEIYEDLSDKNHNNIANHTPLRKVITSNEICDSCNNAKIETFYQNNNILFDYNDSTWDKNEKWAFIVIGLPACGKSTIINDFQDYIKNHTNSNINVNSYNAGDIRRIYENENHNKFNFNDLKSSQKLRDFYAFEALKNLTNDLINNKINIGILDATNTTKKRRKSVLDHLKKISDQNNINIKPLFFEIKTSNKALRRYNIEQKSKNKDYIHMNREIAINDFLERIHKYELSYDKVTLDEINSLNVKYFGIDNVGDTIYYDCGLDHHKNTNHENLTFKSISLNLLYQFLINYRTLYAGEYLTNVNKFYTEGHYIPIQTIFSRPVTPDDLSKMRLNHSNQIISQTNNTNKTTKTTENPIKNNEIPNDNTPNFQGIIST
ncbi:6-phosphofructo-2-kinase [Pichia kluyveri]|uniref:6-phosphofructo-2-kinase n=1 Tax=Pichia kluyveri TaxID=36015 RepID=A0AAV5R1G3_PICKL|nr:6-phosphofructo-2-kinase [Pichia kluyveri]